MATPARPDAGAPEAGAPRLAPPTALAPPFAPPAVPPVPFERAVLDALPLTVWTADLEGRLTSINRSWAQFAADNGAPGLADPASVAGRSIWDSIGDDGSRAELERAMRTLLDGRAPVVRWEFPCNSPDEERVFLMQLSPLREGADRGDPAVTGFVFSTVDITPSHASREALIDTGIALSRTLDLERVYREVAQQVRRAVRGQAFCLAVADEETAALRVVHQYGHEAEMPGKSTVPAGCLPPALAAAIERRLKPAWLDALANERVVTTRALPALAAEGPSDTRGDTRGEPRLVEVRTGEYRVERTVELTAPVTSAEGVLGAMTVRIVDRESPQELEEATRLLTTLAAQTAAAVERAWLVRRVEQKRRLEAIGEVAAGVAHELRNPLFGISSAAQLLRFRVAADPMVEKNVGRILREVERLNRMVTALLEYGRPNVARLEPGDPDAVWDDVLEGQRARLDAKALTLGRVRAAPADATGAPGALAPARCRIDTEQLSQVFLNVLVNACDAAPEGSTLTLVSQLLPNGGWRCRLHNGGPAVPADVLARVFEIFYSTKTGGTGIGLALCQRIIDEHGGTITLESAPEAGTTLTVTLPPA